MSAPYLSHDMGVIQCCKCGDQFGFPKHWLSLPGRLLELKKGIEAAHKCRRASEIKVWQAPTTAGQLAHYYSQAMRRHSFAAR